jgi:hypothetical protein
MRNASLAAIASATLALAACGGSNQEQLNQSDLNQSQSEDLNVLSDEAARVANEAAALENQAAQLQNEAQSEDAAGPQTPADENIQGM